MHDGDVQGVSNEAWKINAAPLSNAGPTPVQIYTIDKTRVRMVLQLRR